MLAWHGAVRCGYDVLRCVCFQTLSSIARTTTLEPHTSCLRALISVPFCTPFTPFSCENIERVNTHNSCTYHGQFSCAHVKLTWNRCVRAVCHDRYQRAGQ